MSGLSGMLPVDKPRGPTSHDVVGAARRALGERRIGHTGTLDPFASGLLLLCIGPATRIAEYLTALPKRYTATIRLGTATDTDDLTGEVIRSDEGWRALDREEVEAALRAQVGTILQRPPAFSAKRVDGERLYRSARRGEAREVEPVEVRIDAIEILRYDPPEVEVRVDCGSGTYIRAIARDAGEALGVGGHLSALRRTRVGRFDVTDAVPLDRLSDGEAVRAAMLSPAAALDHLPTATLDAEGIAAIRHGRMVAAPDLADSDPLALLTPDGSLVAIGAAREGSIRPRKVFA